jgi:MFS transporter, ACS family, tartrate transporter
MNRAESLGIGAPADSSHLLGAAVLRKVAWRLLPFLCVLYLFNIIDRANVGIARRTMQPDLQMSDREFDFGYGVFYFGYLLFEVPANLLLRRIGARRWIARIMISWGLVTCVTLAVTGVWTFYGARILLGIAEAGFFPGIVFFLTFWFPARERARAMAVFMTASALGGVIGNPISGAVMQFLDGVGGLTGWQWVFLAEGLPSVLLGIVVLCYLPDGPARARWLSPPERSWLVDRLEAEDQTRRLRHGADLLRALTDTRVWMLIGVYFTVAVGSNAAGARFPKLIGELFGNQHEAVATAVGLAAAPDGQASTLAISAFTHGGRKNDFVIGLLAALPNICAVLAMVAFGISSDRTGWRRTHVALAALLGAAGWALAFASPWPWLTLAALCVAQAGMMSMLPTFWAIPTAFLSGAAAAGGIALINSVANIGGWFGPNIYGLFGMPAMALILAGGAVLVMCVPLGTSPGGSPKRG